MHPANLTKALDSKSDPGDFYVCSVWYKPFSEKQSVRFQMDEADQKKAKKKKMHVAVLQVDSESNKQILKVVTAWLVEN